MSDTIVLLPSLNESSADNIASLKVVRAPQQADDELDYIEKIYRPKALVKVDVHFDSSV